MLPNVLKRTYRGYAIHPGEVVSRNDRQVHYIGFYTLIRLYNVPRGQCVLWDGDKYRGLIYDDWIHLGHGQMATTICQMKFGVLLKNTKETTMIWDEGLYPLRRRSPRTASVITAKSCAITLRRLWTYWRRVWITMNQPC